MNFISTRLLIPLILMATIASAAEPPATAPTKHFTLHPSPTTKPALRYRLLPDPIDITPGNAATLYLIATSRNLLPDTEVRRKFDTAATPDSEFPRADAENLLNLYRAPLHELETAARRAECHWDLPFRTDGFSTQLPYLGDMRFLARLLALQAHLQITDGKFTDAARTLQTGLALARHLNRDSFLIQMLVGATVTSAMFEQVEWWIQTPGSPNLYWALTDLPVPFCDLRGAIDYERANVMYALPHYREAAEGKLTPEHLGEMLAIVDAVTKGAGKEDSAVISWVRGTLQSAKDLAAAREFLHEEGYTQAAIDAMQPSQLLGLYYVQSYEQGFQDISKWCGLPYPQGRPGLDRAEADFAKGRSASPGNLAYVLVPAMNRVYLIATTVDRRIAELRCLEGVRDYAARHQNQAPTSLDVLIDTPAPVDPITGVGFHYELGDGIITLDAPVPIGGRPQDGRRFELKMETGAGKAR